MKFICNHMMKLTTWFCAFIYEGLQFVSSAILTAYRARRHEQDYIDNQVDTQIIRPFIPTNVSFNEQPLTQNEVQLSDSSTFVENTTSPTVSESQPLQKVLRYKSDAPVKSGDASMTAQPSAPFYLAVPRTPSFQQCFGTKIYPSVK
jgi:hypothetical protein